MPNSLLGSSLPIIQAPMAGGITTVDLVSEVCEAGGVGSFGFAYSSPTQIHADLMAAKERTQGPLNANFFIFSDVEPPAEEEITAACASLCKLPVGKDVMHSVPKAPYFQDLEAQLAPVWVHKPSVLTFHFGLPPRSVIERAHSFGMKVGVSATSLKEAVSIQDIGCDFIVAQGVEAGGHRGTFDPYPPEDQEWNAVDLLKRLCRGVHLPIVSSGGVMTAFDIAERLASGAAGVQMGTAFLCCHEAGSNEIYRHFLMHEQKRPTVFTRAFSGRRARGIENVFTKSMEGEKILSFPLQNTLTAQLRRDAVNASDGEYQSLWAGSKFHAVQSLSVRDLMKQLSAFGEHLSNRKLVVGEAGKG